MNAGLKIILLGGYDTDAVRFFAAAGITNGATKAAVNTAILSAKAGGYWDKIIGWFPMIGGTANDTTCQAQCMKSASHTATFVNGGIHDANGTLGNGTTQYINFATINPSLLGVTGGMGCITRGAPTAAVTRMMGVTDGTDFFLIDTTLATNTRGFIGKLANATQGTAASAADYFVNRTTSTSLKLFRNGTSVASDATSTTVNPFSTYPIFGLNYNSSGIPVPAQYNTQYCTHFRFSAGLTEAEVAAWYTAILAMETALGRNV